MFTLKINLEFYTTPMWDTGTGIESAQILLKMCPWNSVTLMCVCLYVCIWLCACVYGCV